MVNNLKRTKRINVVCQNEIFMVMVFNPCDIKLVFTMDDEAHGRSSNIGISSIKKLCQKLICADKQHEKALDMPSRHGLS